MLPPGAGRRKDEVRLLSPGRQLPIRRPASDSSQYYDGQPRRGGHAGATATTGGRAPIAGGRMTVLPSALACVQDREAHDLVALISDNYVVVGDLAIGCYARPFEVDVEGVRLGIV